MALVPDEEAAKRIARLREARVALVAAGSPLDERLLDRANRRESMSIAR
jgi:hypothetical protein